MTLAEKTLHATMRAVARLAVPAEDERPYLERAAEAMERMADGIGALKYRIARAMLPKPDAPPTITIMISSLVPADKRDEESR